MSSEEGQWEPWRLGEHEWGVGGREDWQILTQDEDEVGWINGDYLEEFMALCTAAREGRLAAEEAQVEIQHLDDEWRKSFAEVLRLEERVRVLEGQIEFLKWSRLIDDSRRWSYEGDTELAVFSLRDSDVIKAMGEEMVALMWAYSRGGATHAEIREVCKQAEQFTRERRALLTSSEGSTEAAGGNDEMGGEE